MIENLAEFGDALAAVRRDVGRSPEIYRIEREAYRLVGLPQLELPGDLRRLNGLEGVARGQSYRGADSWYGVKLKDVSLGKSRARSCAIRAADSLSPATPRAMAARVRTVFPVDIASAAADCRIAKAWLPTNASRTAPSA